MSGGKRALHVYRYSTPNNSLVKIDIVYRVGRALFFPLIDPEFFLVLFCFIYEFINLRDAEWIHKNLF